VPFSCAEKNNCSDNASIRGKTLTRIGARQAEKYETHTIYPTVNFHSKPVWRAKSGNQTGRTCKLG
jgi:hypothetical protein